VQSAFYMGYFLLSMPAPGDAPLQLQGGLVTGLMLYSAHPVILAGGGGREVRILPVRAIVIASGWPSWKPRQPVHRAVGDPASSERRLNFSQAFNPLGAITGALWHGLHLLRSRAQGNQYRRSNSRTIPAYLQHETMRVITPYLCWAA